MTKKTETTMTREQLIEKAWAHHSSTTTRRFAPEKLPLPPESRTLVAGMSVSIGNLVDAVVIETRHEGRLALIDYTSIDTNYGRPTRTEHCLGVWAWHDCLPNATINKTAFARNAKATPQFSASDISALLNLALSRGIVDNPDYQRGYTWTPADKEAYIDSVFNQRSLGHFLFVNYPFEKYRGELEVLDGKQRLSTLVDYYCSRFAYRGRHYHEISIADQNAFQSARIQYAELDGKKLSRADLLQIFLDVNAAGVPQTREHLNHVRRLLAAERSLPAEDVSP